METATPKLASSIELAALPTAVALARLHTVKMLRLWQLPDDVIETARLLVSELATNAMPDRYGDGHRPTYAELDDVRRFWLQLRSKRDRSSLLIEVTDSNPRPPVPKTVTDNDESGRGLMLIALLSRNWGHFYRGAFKIVWCEVACVDTDPVV